MTMIEIITTIIFIVIFITALLYGMNKIIRGINENI